MCRDLLLVFLFRDIFIPHHTIEAGYYGFKLVSVCQSVHLSICLLYVSLLVFLFPDDNYNGFARNLVCALIWWRSALGLLIGDNISIF